MPTAAAPPPQVVSVGGVVDAEAAFVLLFGGSPDAFWLDSAALTAGARYSIVGDAGGPLGHVRTFAAGDGVFGALDAGLRGQAAGATSDVPGPFKGGYVGWFGYELRGELGSPHTRRAATPDAAWLFCGRFVVVDHVAGTTHVVSLVDDGWAERAADVLRRCRPLPGPPPQVSGFPLPVPDGRRYRAAVESCLDALRAGESYELCFTDEIGVAATGEPFDVYRRLRRVNPAPYGAFLRIGGTTVCSSSPERFLHVGADGVVETKPIKGTARRTADPVADAGVAAALRADPKSLAENLMIVDLMRNDLGRVCEIGSVTVPAFCAVESYATVHQLVSTVRGRLRPGLGSLDAVAACFPPGSMTGAPKLASMAILDGLEGRARGIYSGALGYLSCDGAADLSVVIRTLVATGGEFRIAGGGAVVLDSDPDAEYREAVDKIAAVASAVCGAAGAPSPFQRA